MNEKLNEIEWVRETTDNAFYPSYNGVFQGRAIIKLFKTVHTKDRWKVESWSLNFTAGELDSVSLEDAQREAIEVTIKELRSQIKYASDLADNLEKLVM